MPILKQGEMGTAVLYVKIFQEMEVIKLSTVWNVKVVLQWLVTYHLL